MNDFNPGDRVTIQPKGTALWSTMWQDFPAIVRDAPIVTRGDGTKKCWLTPLIDRPDEYGRNSFMWDVDELALHTNERTENNMSINEGVIVQQRGLDETKMVEFPAVPEVETFLIPPQYLMLLDEGGPTEVEVLRGRVSDLERDLYSVRDAHEDWKRDLGKAAMDLARQHDWCPVASEFLHEWGIPVPATRKRITLYVTFDAEVQPAHAEQNLSWWESTVSEVGVVTDSDAEVVDGSVGVQVEDVEDVED
jgi:hypothetical protein